MSTKKNITQEKSEKNYNTKEILNETHWKSVNVQEIPFFNEEGKVYLNHLSLISQGLHTPNEYSLYDNNYYYPSSAGKDVDIYIVDTGLHTSLSPKEFDNYEGTSDRRVISCDGIIYDGKFHSVNATEKYECSSHNISMENKKEYYHGTVAAITAAGTINGAAKKANIHALAPVMESESILVTMDYIKKNGQPHKTLINFSFGLLPYSQVIQDKLNEMTKEGFIFILAAGNRGVNVCTTTEDFATYDGFITVGAFDVNKYNRIDPNELSPYIIKRSFYSDYGECLDIFAPGTIHFKNFDNGEFIFEIGTSFSCPLVAGVAATLISDRPEIQYDVHQMKQTLIDLSLKDVIEDLKDNTPNRLLNNGKHITYSLPRCDRSSNEHYCGENGCCSVHGFCVDPETPDSSLKSLCYVENECQSEFGTCYDGNCNHKNSINRCSSNECCSVYGECINRENDCKYLCFTENGCLSEFNGQCLSSNLGDINKYNEKDQEIILKYNCEKELEPFEICECQEYFDDNDCKMYRENNCEEFINSPYKFAPTCEKLSEESKKSFPIINIQSNYYKLNKSTCKIVCARKDPKSSDERCEISKYQDYTDLTLVEKSCKYEECREGLKSYFNIKYIYYLDLLNSKPSEYNEGMVEQYKILLEVASSEDCLLSEFSDHTTELTTSTLDDSDLPTTYIYSDPEIVNSTEITVSIEEEEEEEEDEEEESNSELDNTITDWYDKLN